MDKFSVEQLRSDHYASFQDRNLDDQVALLRQRLNAGTLSPDHVKFAAKIGDRASQQLLGQPQRGAVFSAFSAAISAKDATQEKARALIAMARCRLSEWRRAQDQVICDASNCITHYDAETSRVTFLTAVGLCSNLKRPYYKEYSTHYVLHCGAGISYAIRDWGELSDGSEWIELGASMDPINSSMLTQLSVRNADWISSTHDMSVTTDVKGWTTATWLNNGTASGSIRVSGGDKTIRLDGMPGKDTPSKVLWAAQKCVICPCRLHGAVCVFLDEFASSWRSRWGGLTPACLAAAQLVPKNMRLTDRWPWGYSTLDGNELPPDELIQVTTELTLWVLQLIDPVADDVQKIERTNDSGVE